MKRNKNLIKFSHEHHHALIFATRLRRSGNAPAGVLAAYICDFWDNYLESHFHNEEKWLLPYIDDNALKNEFLQDHYDIRTMCTRLPDDRETLRKLASDLAGRIEHHVRFEERVLFPHIEKRIPVEKLEEIGRKLSDIEINSHVFSPPFWEK